MGRLARFTRRAVRALPRSGAIAAEYAERARQLLAVGFLPPPLDGMQTFERMHALHGWVRRFARRSTGVALEIGCFRGCSTVFLAKACLARGIGEIYALDLFTGTPSWPRRHETFADCRERLVRWGVGDAVTLIRADSQGYPWSKAVDVLHVDADHDDDAVSRDVAKYVPFVAPGGLAIFDDFDAHHGGVRRAVLELLLRWPEFQIVDVHPDPQAGSICLRRAVAPPA